MVTYLIKWPIMGTDGAIFTAHSCFFKQDVHHVSKSHCSFDSALTSTSPFTLVRFQV